MDYVETFAEIASQKDGPIKKFQLIKIFGSALRQSGSEPAQMSCAELEKNIAAMLQTKARED
jgi:hypothetical protein